MFQCKYPGCTREQKYANWDYCQEHQELTNGGQDIKQGTARKNTKGRLTKTISMSQETFERLGTFGKKTDTWDDVLVHIMDNYNPDDSEAMNNMTRTSRRTGRWGIPSH